ncbi:hypothetical protein D3C79_602030 [compost metagenome]
MGPQDFPQHPIDAEPDDQHPLEGLDVDVGRLLLDRLAQHGVDEADDGGIVIGVEQILALGQLLRQGEEVHLVAEILHQLACLGGVTLVVGRQQIFEFVAAQLLHREVASRHAPHLQQGLRRDALTTEQQGGALPLGQDHPEVAGEGKRQLGQRRRQVGSIELVGRHQGCPCTKGCPWAGACCTWECAPVAVACCWAFISSICFCTSGESITS